MNRRRIVQLATALMPGLALGSSRAASAQDSGLPEGVPENSQEAVVNGHEDGDKFTVAVDGTQFTVLMISANAPESDGCFYLESAARLRKLLPVGTTIYLERDGEAADGKDRLLCYTWLPREGKKAQFIDERMIADGFSTFKARDGHGTRDSRLKKAEDLAKSEKRGIWADGACSKEEDTEAAKPTEPPKLGSGDDPAPIGTTLTTDGQEITVSSAYFSYDFGFSSPKGGYVFIVIEATIKNVDDSEHGYDESRFSAKDLDTDANFDDTFTLADAPLGSGELSPGEYVIGQAVLEVQDSSTRVRIKYDAKSIGGGEVYWLVTR